MNKKQPQLVADNEFLIDLALRIKAIETILLEKDIVTESEYDAIIKNISEKISKNILEKASVIENLDNFVKTFKN